MLTNYSGRVLFHNQLPAGAVQVRVIDPGEAGAPDAEYTTKPGFSDETGAFMVTYEQPQASGLFNHPDLYLQFCYSLASQSKIFNAPLVPIGSEYRLPERSPVKLIPSLHGFQFDNRFVGYPLPFTLPALPGLNNVSGIYGLCGGMSSSVYDFLLAGRVIPQTTEVPDQGDDLQRYLFKRQMDSLGVLGESILKFAEWMVMPDEGLHGIQSHTMGEFVALRDRLEKGSFSVLGIVYVDWRNGFKLWNNHQVLVYDYTYLNSKTFEIRIYDPNFSKHDDITIRAERVVVETKRLPSGRKSNTYGLVCTQWMGAQQIHTVRGFFLMPYQPVMPPENLI